MPVQGRFLALLLLGVCAVSARADQLAEHTRLRGFSHPSAAFDAEGNVYVADFGNNRVAKYSPSGDSLACVSGSGWGDTQFDGPAAIAVRGIDVFVADRGNHRIQRFDRALSFVASLSTRESAREQERFGYPRGIALSPQGDLYIVDGEGIRIVKITPFNQVERSFGAMDAGTARLVDPTAICAESAGIINIVDAGTLKRFDAFGTPRGILPLRNARSCEADADRMMVLCDDGILIFRVADDPVRLPLPPGTWNGIAARGSRVALWNDHDVAVFELHP